MNTPFASGKTCNRCGGWDGPVAGFPNQSMFKLCTCCKHERPTMTNQYALGYKAGLEAAVKVCRENAEAWGRLNADDEKHGAERCADEIAALPVSEVKWRDLTDDDLMEVLCELAASNVVNDSVFARAVIAKFKEVNGA